MAKEVILTLDGKRKLEERLDQLINVRRMEVAERIRVAREFGDISENAEYDAAKDEQAMVEAEIKEIEDQLANAVLISDKDVSGDLVVLGSFVKIHDLDYNEKQEYQIVGAAEADINEHRISNESPLAKALLGHKKGDTVTVHAPQGDIGVKVIGIRR